MRRLAGLGEAVKPGKSREFQSDGKWYEIRWSEKKNRFVVAVTDENWDYEDEAAAGDMSNDIKDAKTVEDAAEILGI